jgi:DNA processing protein
MDPEKIYKVALGLIPGIGSVLAKQLVSYCGSAKAVFESGKTKLLKVPGIGPTLTSNIMQSEALRKAEEQIVLAEKNGVSLLFFTDNEYPERLKHAYDAPPLLYFKGTANLNTARIIAIVGTRQSTDYGRQCTEQLVAELKKYNCLILSGLAYGIDITAHKAALKHEMPTVAAMASGMDIIYPAVHKSVAQQMVENGGGLLTENPFGTKPDAPQFPARNRIIAGLCDALVVSEAAAKGGALITADIANSYNKDVFAIPGNINQKVSEGCNNLIKSHQAALLTDVQDIVACLNWDLQKPVRQPFLFETMNFSEEENRVINLLRQSREMMIDELTWRSEISAGRLASLLLNLELQGLVKVLPGKKFTLTEK